MSIINEDLITEIASGAGVGNGSASVLVTSAARAADFADSESYSLLVETSVATGVVLGGVGSGFSVLESMIARDRQWTGSSISVLEAASVAGMALAAPADIPMLRDRAVATGGVAMASATTSVLVVDAAIAGDMVDAASSVLVVGKAAATGTGSGTRTVSLLLADTALAASSASGSVASDVVLGDAARASDMASASSKVSDIVVDIVEVRDMLLVRDPGRVGFVMNTESTAGSIYENFNFDSVVQVGGKTFGVGLDGLYELVGDTDDGEPINARVTTGMLDFGVSQTKRLENLYLGYTSNGRISVTFETYGSNLPPFTYLMEPRAAGAPVNGRVQPGKGLWGRYWRMTLANVLGKDFEVYDMAADVAVSPRRV